jgi:sporulation protein YlmC with PRC-barrel domain
MDHSRKVLSACTLATFKVENSAGESLGKIEDLMIDLASGRVACAVLSFVGTLGMEGKLFAIPWAELKADPERDKIFILDNPNKNSYPSLETSTLMGGKTGSPSLRRCNRSNSAIARKAGGR